MFFTLQSKVQRYGNLYKIHAMSRNQLEAMADFVDFDIELHPHENLGWIEFDGFDKKAPPLMPKKHFVITQKHLFFYNGEDYFEMKRADIKAIRGLFPKNKDSSKSPYLRYPILAKEYIISIINYLGLTGITWRKVDFRELDFICSERDGTKFIFEMLEDLTRMTGTQVQHIFLHSCFSGAEFYNEQTQNYLLSCARMCSTLFKDSFVTGCVGINADAKATHLLLEEDIIENSAMAIGRHFNLTNSLVTYQNGLVIKKPQEKFSIKSQGPFLKILQNLLFPNEVRPYLQLQYLDEVYQHFAESKTSSFGDQQARLYSK